MRKDFTLIEIIVVITIIAILVGIATPAVNRFIQKSRDAKRLADMGILVLALETFYDDNGRYPNSLDNVTEPGECIGAGGRAIGSVCVGSKVDGDIDRALRTYVRGGIPLDPLYSNKGGQYYYAYDPSHTINWPISVDWSTEPPTCNGTASTTDDWPLIGFRRSETRTLELHKDTCTNSDMDLGDADYNIALTEPE